MTAKRETEPEPSLADGIYVFDSRALTSRELWRLTGFSALLRFFYLRLMRRYSRWPLDRGQPWPLRSSVIDLEALPSIVQRALHQWQAQGFRPVYGLRTEILGAHELDALVLTDSEGRNTATCALHRSADRRGRINETLVLTTYAICEDGTTIVTANGREIFEGLRELDRAYLGDASIKAIWERHRQRCAGLQIPARDDKRIRFDEDSYSRRVFRAWAERGLLRPATDDESATLQSRAESCERCGGFLDPQKRLERQFCEPCLERQTDEAQELAKQKVNRRTIASIAVLLLSPLLVFFKRLDLLLLVGLAQSLMILGIRKIQTQSPPKAELYP